ncbi:hypothetical protein D3C77_428060 [compost metagenome]
MKNRMALGNRQVIERGPKETEGVTMIVECLVNPLLRQRNMHLAALKRPNLIKVPCVPTTQIADNRGRVDSGLFAQLAQRGFVGCFTGLDRPFYQLYACQWMAE